MAVANADTRFYRLKAAQRDLIAYCGGILRAAEITSASKSEVGRWNNAADPDLMSFPATLALEAECGVPVVTTVMAELNGRRLADPDASEVAQTCLWQAQAEMVRTAAELMSAGALAMADGKVTSAEAMKLDRDAAKLERALADYRQAAAGIRAVGLSVVEGGAK